MQSSKAVGEEDGTSSGFYVLRPLVQDVPLTEDAVEDAYITCVELCGDNLYIGTSQAEVLHFVSIPPDPSDDSQAPVYIFASRLKPSHNAQVSSQSPFGVQQILVLPKVQKACILCNGTLSFYSLPELSPAFGNTTVPNCTWVGGIDLSAQDETEEHGSVVMICVKNKVRLVKIADEVRRVRDIQYPGCLISTRRGDYACAADAHGYALLDVENQQKISLFPISSLDENPATGKVEDLSPNKDPRPARTSSLSRPVSTEGAEGKGHGRSTSLGAFVGGIAKRQPSPQSTSRDRSTLTTPEPFAEENSSPARSPSHAKTESSPVNPPPRDASPNKPLPLPPRTDSLRPPPKSSDELLKPHISSPTPTEFLLTTGTSASESGVGIFVNLDGDVVRGTLEFSRYPTSVIVDGLGSEVDDASGSSEVLAGFVLATMTRTIDGADGIGVEIQRWDTDNGGKKEWLTLPKRSIKNITSRPSDQQQPLPYGLRTVDTAMTVADQEVGALLRGQRLMMPNVEELDASASKVTGELRNKEEAEFGRRLGGQIAKNVLWAGASIWWIVKSPLVIRLEAALNQAVDLTYQSGHVRQIDRSAIIRVTSGIRGQEPSTETEFLSLEYVRQKASVILFADLLKEPTVLSHVSPADLRITEGLLLEGSVDPRIILALIPTLKEEVVEGDRGIWVHAGLIPVFEDFSRQETSSWSLASNTELLLLVKKYLHGWRQRKGFGSIADEMEVFKSVDAALLRLLLIQDDRVSSQNNKPSPEKLELYALVDSGVDCFDRATNILEQQHRLYILSRLYQSRRMARKVLETWKRIIEGEQDRGNDLIDGENEVRRYLINVKDTALVDEYGTWLAGRNPAIGVQVFTNEASRVKWEPNQVVMLLRRRAPDAVKDYLEHLVFGKKNVKYANDLISYYLDSLLAVLESSEDARQKLAQTYEFYRALRPPKPTYREYITSNALPDSWWHDRLRLLELIGGSHGSGFSYDVGQVLSRIEPFEQDLVPESIILDGRQARHEPALKLLTHGLGDYHTAVNYCLLGGASIFHPTQGSVPSLIAPSRDEQAILFGYLLREFLRIEDVSDRLERTSELLARFSSWYDVRQVLDLIPETWSVELVADFLISAFRRLVQEKNEAMITKALSGAENLQVADAFVEKCRTVGPQRETEKVT